MAENIIEVIALDHLDDLSQTGALSEKINKIKNDDDEISEISLFVKNEKGEYARSFSYGLVEDQQEAGDATMAENARKFALSVNDAFAYLSNDNGVRHWNVTKSIKDKEGNVAGILLMKLSLEGSDALVEKTIVQVYLLSIGAVIVVLLLIFNHLRLFSFEVKARKLEEIDKMKDDFISMASHELKTPLTAISGYTELLADSFSHKDDGDIEMARKKYIGNIDISVKRLKTLVEDLLDVSRLEQNRLPFDFQSTDVAAVVNALVQELSVTAKQKNLELSNNIEKLSNVNVDPERVKQILVNLIGNAIKYTPSGKVELQAKEDEKWVYITVADSGIGISAENLKQLFTKFYRIRSDQTASITGTGLGLWIAHEIAAKMGGELNVESIEGVGSHFTLKLKKS